MNALRQSIATIVELASQMIDELDDETMLALTDLLNAAAQRLSQGAGEAPTAPPPSGPTGEPPLTQAMPSSNVEGFGYDEENGRLLVRFLGKHPDPNGPIYAYEGVPKVIFDIFRKGGVPAMTDGHNKWGQWWRGKKPSIGAALYHLIKIQGYPYQRLT